MDETVMLDWIDLILAPYVAEAPAGIVPVLFLDSYRAHMMKSVVARVQALGVDVFHIPGGCTGLCQPVDVGFNKPLKTRMRSQWEEWMSSKWDDMAVTDVTPKPTREIVSEWVCGAFDNFPDGLVRNAWTKTGYAWFEKDHVEVEDEDEDLADDYDDDLVLRMDWSVDASDDSGATDTITEDSASDDDDNNAGDSV
jgi:hypothetical protein